MMQGKIKKNTVEWFEKKLYNFFISRYADCQSAEFYQTPNRNQYVFDFPDRKQRIILTCQDDGSIEEKIFQYTSTALEQSSRKIQRAVEKHIDYINILNNMCNEKGKYLPLAVEVHFYKTVPENEE